MTLLAAVALSLSVMAQQDYSNYVGLNLGCGINSMSYSPQGGSYKLTLGGSLGLHYTHFFGDHFGMGFGVQYVCANSKAVFDFTETTPNLTHPDNTAAKYDLNTTFDGWRERQHLGILSVPVEFFWRAPVCESSLFIAGLGASFDLPLSGKLRTDRGTYSTAGYFPSLGYEVTDVPTHGFGTFGADQEKDIDNLKFGISVICDLGFRMALNNNWGLYLGIYGGYGVTSMLKEQSGDPMLSVDPADPKQHTYNGAFASNQVDALHLLRAGVKIGIDLGWSGDEGSAKPVVVDNSALLARQKFIEDSIAAAKAAAVKLAREKTEALLRSQAEAAALAQAEAAARAAAEKAEAERAARVQARLDSIAAAQAFMPAKPVTRQEMQKKLDDINATVYFETAGTTPKFDEKTDAIIRTLCASMMADDKLIAEITGHTDNVGSAATNMKYGQKRADALKKYMISLGAPAKNIETKSRGMEQPIVPNDSDENRAKNRRATVILK